MTDNFTDIRPNALIMLNGDLFEYLLHKSVHPMYKSFPNQLQPAALCALRSS